MTLGLGRTKLVLAGIAAIGLGAAVSALPRAGDPSSLLSARGEVFAAASAPTGIDALVTGSLPPAGRQPPSGTDRFRTALKSFADKDYKGAFAGAAELDDLAERRAVQWAAIYYGYGAVDHQAVLGFEKEAPDFASTAVFKTRLEQALLKEQPTGKDVIALLGGAMPNTIDAQIALALAYESDGQTERARRIVRSIWVDNFLDADTEKAVLAKLGGLLDQQAHWDRAVHLMMHDRATAVERLLDRLTPAQKTLAVARNAVSRNASDAKKLLDTVDPSLQTHPVFVYSRAQRARQFALYDDALSWLAKAEGPLPGAAEWWYERRSLTRTLLARGDAKRAYQAAAGYTSGPDGRLVEAHFHAGWIALAFLKDAKAAEGHFVEMSRHSTLPDSVTQANYWLGRARTALGDKDGAATAFGVAADYATVFYGQLARDELGLPPVTLRSMPESGDSAADFDSRPVVRAVELLADNEQKTAATTLLRSFAMDLPTGGEMVLAARLAQKLEAHSLAIQIADAAERRGMPMDLFSFPKDGLPAGDLAQVDAAAVYAVTRQESRFQVDAVSSAGARGLMQLMPGTARETAEKVGLAYEVNRLTSDPGYNALLGSTYLAAQLKRFDGSLLLAAAAYNAGASNVDKWIAAYGDPRADTVDAVIWAELIPFQETRKYVQRVLGNYLVYRARLGQADLTTAEALRRIPG